MRRLATWTVNGGILGALLILVVVGAVSFLSIRDLTDHARHVDRSRQIVAGLDEIMSSLKDVESGARGFAITGNEEYLVHCDRAAESIKAQIAELRAMTGDEPEWSRNIDRVAPMLDRRIAIASTLIDLRKQKGAEAATEFVRTNVGLDAMKEIRSAVGKMREDEIRPLEERHSRMEASAAFAKQSILLGGVFALLLMAAAGFIISRDMRRQRREEDAQAERVRLAAFAAEVGLSLSQGSTVDEMLRGVADAMVKHVDAALARIWKYNTRDETLDLLVSAGPDTGVDDSSLHIPIGRTVIGLIAQEWRSHTTNDYPNDPRTSDPEWARREGIIAFSGHPLVVGNRLVGVMAVFSRKPLGEFAVKALAAGADGIALGIERRLAEEALEASEFRVRAILEHSSDGIISIDEAGIMEGVNPAAERMFGYEANEMLGKNIGMLMPEPARSRHHEYVKRYIATGRKTVPWARREIVVLRKDGSELPVELSISEIRLGARRIFAGTFRDIAERKEAQEAMLRAKEVSETANRSKSEFLSNMSHELRTPLNSVIGFANILLKNKTGALPPQDLLYLARILENGKHLLKLINEVLDLSKIEAGRMEITLSTVNLGDLTREVLELLEPQTRDRDVILEAVIPPYVAPINSDADKLKQCLINLVGNALKFAEHGRVTVRLTVEEGTHRPTLIEVEDTGIGIPKDRQSVIFEAFRQADSTTARKHGGTGLGLTITRSFLHLLGYTIDVVSEPGKGSNFRVHLTPPRPVTRRFAARRRAEPARPPERAVSPEAARLATGKRVLVVDDDDDARLLLAEYLREEGCEVIVADHGVQGLITAREARPDLILLDLVMPGMDGWEVLRQLKRDTTVSAIPVVIVSVVATEGPGLASNADGVLRKPITRGDVHDLLGYLFALPKANPLLPNTLPPGGAERPE